MNGFTSADMSTAAANGFRDGLAAQPAASQEAVGEVYWNNETGEIEVNWLYGDLAPSIGTLLYDAPVAAAPTDEDYSVVRASTPAAPGIDLEQFREAVVEWRKQSAATLKQLQRGLTPLGGSAEELMQSRVSKANELLALIDASANGGHCTTCACDPNMTPAVRFDLAPAMVEGEVRNHLIALGWTPPASPKGEQSGNSGELER